MPLPASAKVIRAVRVAQNDSSEFYEVQMPTADVEAWKQSLITAVAGLKEEPAERWTEGPSPVWFKPNVAGLTTQLLFYDQTTTKGFQIYFTPNATTVFVCWYET